jgi:transposase
MLKGGQMKQIYELHGQGLSVRRIATILGISRNSVRKYLRSPGVPRPKPRAPRGSKLDPYTAYVRERVAAGMDNCVVLLRELQARGYTGKYTVLKDLVQPLRRRAVASGATMRYETAPGEQAQVDFGYCTYTTSEETTRGIWVFVLVLGWSRALYVEFVRRADTATFLRCHVNAFRLLGGVPQRCLYDNPKIVVLARDEAGQPVWNPRFLDFTLRVGFDAKLCHPYRPQTKGKVESGVGYVKKNFWPTAQFVDDADLNRQAQTWVDTVANVRVHGTTRERPVDRLAQERSQLRALPEAMRLRPFLREERKVGRDGYVRWDGAWYGVLWTWAGKMVQVDATDATVEVWAGPPHEQRLAVHPRATQPGQRFTLPGQWAGLPAAATGSPRPRQETLAVQVPAVVVETRPLQVYAALAGETSETTVKNVGPVSTVPVSAVPAGAADPAALAVAAGVAGSGPC